MAVIRESASSGVVLGILTRHTPAANPPASGVLDWGKSDAGVGN